MMAPYRRDVDRHPEPPRSSGIPNRRRSKADADLRRLVERQAQRLRIATHGQLGNLRRPTAAAQPLRAPLAVPLFGGSLARLMAMGGAR